LCAEQAAAGHHPDEEWAAAFPVATDLAPRGLQNDDPRAVVNYDIPEVRELNVHRIAAARARLHSRQAITLAFSSFFGSSHRETYKI
jgi:superfamily II DNA/RNA helicase